MAEDIHADGLDVVGSDEPPPLLEKNGRVRLVAVDRITDGRAVTVPLGGERVAVFRYDGKVSAVSNAICWPLWTVCQTSR